MFAVLARAKDHRLIGVLMVAGAVLSEATQVGLMLMFTLRSRLLRAGITALAIGLSWIAPVLVTPISIAGAASKPVTSRTITIEMQGIAYKPAVIRVKARETVVLRFVNNTNTPHEALVGDTDAQIVHARAMEALAEAGATGRMTHSPKNYVFSKPHSTVTLRYTFGQAGRTAIGCHQPGHWKSGMRIVVLIKPG